MKPVIWLLSAYRSDSHAAWCDWLCKHLDAFDWQIRELPGRHFAWRIRSNPLSWLDRLPEKPPDLVLATSMVDLATLKGLHPRLGRVPCWYFFHENQMAYPINTGQVRSVEPKMVQLYGALAADRLLFNSAYNRDSFLDGLDAFLARMPDQVPADIRARIKPRCRLLPVPVKPVAGGQRRKPRLIIWNHRWEYDKAPARFADAMISLADLNAPFRLALLGPRAVRTPEPLQRLRSALGDRIVVDGKVSRPEYLRWLGQADIAVSTAIHEFQGIGMLEAVSAGATPLVPDALCYREQYPADYRFCPDDSREPTATLSNWIEQGPPPAPDVNSWLDSQLKPIWQRELSRISA